MAFSQKDRSFRLECPKLATDELLLTAFHGFEAVSQPFEITVEMVSENARIDGKSLLREPMTITFNDSSGQARELTGHVRRFWQLGRDEIVTSYRAELVPWLAFADFGMDSRIFQKMDTMAIVEEVLKPYGAPVLRCSRGQKREYCVQYRESDLAFVSRLLEDEGIFYFFEHEGGECKLVLADTPSAFAQLSYQGTADYMEQAGRFMDGGVVTALRAEQAYQVARVQVKGWDPLQPAAPITGVDSSAKSPELYEYPEWWTSNGDAKASAKRRREGFSAVTETAQGHANVLCFSPGFKFELKRHYRSDMCKQWALLRVEHHAVNEAYHGVGRGEDKYENSFMAIPAGVPYRPLHVTPRPRVQGSQTAIVVGPAGEEIFTDKYGRVKVQFHWDRKGQKNENSSCWVRVSTTWAGKGWGAIHLPRIGQEVIVDFLEGDPDQPIITGRVYNAEQVVPYALPANQTQSGIISRSSKGGTAAHYNEIRFEDKKGSELLHIHAEKDETHDVEANRSRTVGGNETVVISGSQHLHVKKNRNEDVEGDETIAVLKDHSTSVGGNQILVVDGDRSAEVKGSEVINIGQDQNIAINGRQEVSIGKDCAISISGELLSDVKKDSTQMVAGAQLLAVEKRITIQAKDDIVIGNDNARVTLKKNGDIVIKGKNIKFDSEGKIEGKASGKVSFQGSTIAMN